MFNPKKVTNMKKCFSLAVVALFVSMTANAQYDYESSRTQGETTSETRIVEEKPEYKNYDRFFFSYAPTRVTNYYSNGALMMHGFGMGWKKGINVTGKRLPLYVETGIAANFAFGHGDDTSRNYSDNEDKLFNFVIPINATYRFKIAQTKIFIGPYWGLNFKINYFWDGHRNYFDSKTWDSNRFQLGTEFGCNFDIYNFHLGIGWSYDFMKLATDYRDYTDWKTSGVRVNVGVVF